MTYYDFNRDRFIDILALSSSTNSLKIYIWNEKDNKYSKFGTHSISSAEVDSVIAADLNKDEKIDIILMKKIKQNETA